MLSLQADITDVLFYKTTSNNFLLQNNGTRIEYASAFRQVGKKKSKHILQLCRGALSALTSKNKAFSSHYRHAINMAYHFFLFCYARRSCCRAFRHSFQPQFCLRTNVYGPHCWVGLCIHFHNHGLCQMSIFRNSRKIQKEIKSDALELAKHCVPKVRKKLLRISLGWELFLYQTNRIPSWRKEWLK